MISLDLLILLRVFGPLSQNANKFHKNLKTRRFSEGTAEPGASHQNRPRVHYQANASARRARGRSMASTAAPVPAGNKLTANFDKARAEYEAAQAAMLRHAEELERINKELRHAQQAVLDRERALVEAALKDGVTATTATAAMVALNPATAAKVPARVHPPRPARGAGDGGGASCCCLRGFPGVPLQPRPVGACAETGCGTDAAPACSWGAQP